MSEIKVTVVKYGQKFLRMKYVDPITGKVVVRSCGTKDRKRAERMAAVWEAELQEGRYKSPSKVTWQEFRQRYESERLPALAPRTSAKVTGVFNAIEEMIGVDRLAKLDAAQISKFQRLLRDERKIAEATIKGILAHLHASLTWAKRVGLLNAVPTIEMPTRGKGGGKMMKGRPISGEEFERLLAKVPDVIGKPDSDEPAAASAAARWQWFLRGLWFSGLRLGEALDLSWDQPGHITVDLSGKFAMFVIPGDKQKSGEDQLLPVAPEFAEMLAAIPLDDRTGPVFKFGRRDQFVNPKLLAVSKLISDIGEKAGVVVNKQPQKFASAHDFRRSFGERWSTRVMPATLQAMMRHADISTTMKFYVGQNGQKAAADIMAAYQRHIGQNQPSSNTFINTEAASLKTDNSESTQPIQN